MLRHNSDVGSPLTQVPTLRGPRRGTVGRQQVQDHLPIVVPQFDYDVGIVGMGYVGLPTALSFTTAGRSVVGVDSNPERLADIRSGFVDAVPADRERLGRSMRDGSLDLTTSPDAITRSAAVIICVPTPVDHHLVPDIAALKEACTSVVRHVAIGQVIILTSTSYVGTTRDLLVTPLSDAGLRIGSEVFVAFSPERIDPGNEAYPQEMVPRVVGGVTSECAARAVEALSAYATRVHVVSSPEAAELTKLLENTFRAVNIAMINEIADLSDELHLDVVEVINAANTKPTVSWPSRRGLGSVATASRAIPTTCCGRHASRDWRFRSSSRPWHPSPSVRDMWCSACTTRWGTRGSRCGDPGSS